MYIGFVKNDVYKIVLICLILIEIVHLLCHFNMKFLKGNYFMYDYDQ